jgi:hypothetical protein
MAERTSVVRLLQDVEVAVEDLLLTGLTSASDVTRQTLATAFEAVSRMRLLRLGFTLRVATEEIARFARNDAGFSRRRFGFFLSRAWMLSRGLRQSIEKEDAVRWDLLTHQPSARPLGVFDAVSLGVSKRVVPGAFAAFEFRLRVLTSGDLPEGTPLIWSAVFPIKAGVDLPAEAYLHLPQAQRFKASILLPGLTVRIAGGTLTDEGRLILTREATVEPVPKPFKDWDRFLSWDQAAALSRLEAHTPGPFDLEVELQEEVVLRDFTVGPPAPVERERQLRFPVTTPIGPCYVTTGIGPEDAGLRQRLMEWSSPNPAPLYGLLHYEMCRFAFQPLTFFGSEGPEAVQLQQHAVDAATLVRALKFT